METATSQAAENSSTLKQNKSAGTRSNSSLTVSSTSEEEEKPRQQRHHTSKTLYWRRDPVKVAPHYENRRWHELHLDLARINKDENTAFYDKAGRRIEPTPIASPEKVFEMIFSRYITYCAIARQLDNCYFYLIHPQKRALLRACLTGVISRILELRNELILIDQREYHFVEDMLHSLGLTHADIELRIPLFIREARAKLLADREKILSMLYVKLSSSTSIATPSQDRPLTREEAILKIQRQTRYYLGVIKSEMARQVLRPKLQARLDAIQTNVVNKWRVYTTRKECFGLRKKMDVALDMAPDEKPGSASITTFTLSTRNRARMLQNEKEYEMDQIATEDEMYTKEGPFIAWSIHYNIKQWLLEVRDVLGTFSSFPEETEGGSLALFADRDLRDVADDLTARMATGKFVFPPPEKKKKTRKEKKVPRKSPWKDGRFEYVLEETDCMREMNARTEEYDKFWYFKNDFDNLDQVHDRNLLKEQIGLVVADQIRLQVDELIRNELANLVYAVDRVPRKGAKADKKKNKKEKPEKKVKGDLTPDKTIEELFEELVTKGIIRYSPKAELSDFVGDFSYSATVLDQAKQDPLLSLGDVRRMVKEFAVLPLSYEPLHKNAPLIRKLLIAGIRESGKKLLLRAICHETGATFFDITPKNLEGKYDTPEGKKMIMHLIMKVGKAMEPSIFWVGKCEKMFLKKKDKEDTSKPHQWVKAFQKTLKKGIKNGDRMMLIGTSSRPSLTKQKKFNKFFDRIIVVPYPEYPSRYLAWRHFISYNLGVPLSPYFDLSSLTKVTAGYTVGAIKKACERVLTEERKASLPFSPLKATDFINVIWMQDPIYKEEQDQLVAWYKGTPLAKQRQLRVHEDDEEESSEI